MSGDNRKIVGNNIKRLMEAAEKDRRTVAAETGISYSTLSDWINGGSYPRINKIEMLADYFGVPKTELTEIPRPKINTTEKLVDYSVPGQLELEEFMLAKNHEPPNPEMIMLTRAARNLSYNNMMLLIQLARALGEKEDKNG